MKHVLFFVFTFLFVTSFAKAQTNSCDTLPGFVSKFGTVYAWGVVYLDSTDTVGTLWAADIAIVGDPWSVEMATVHIYIDARLSAQKTKNIIDPDIGVSILEFKKIKGRSYTRVSIEDFSGLCGIEYWKCIENALQDYKLSKSGMKFLVREILKSRFE